MNDDYTVRTPFEYQGTPVRPTSTLCVCFVTYGLSLFAIAWLRHATGADAIDDGSAYYCCPEEL